MKPMKVSANAPHRLLVEGKDDQHTIIHLLRRHGLDYEDPPQNMPFIHVAEGIAPLLESLPVAAKTYKRVGLVIDADQDPQARWEEVRNRLQAKSAGIQLPENLSVDGTISMEREGRPRVGIWLMPDNAGAGTLETFLTHLVPAGDRCWSHARTSTEEAKRLGAAYPETSIQKAQIHTWLSWQEEPGLPLGTAVKAKYFSDDSPQAKKFVDWFRRLFID